MLRRKPDFENVRRALRGEEPSRPTLFELFMNWPLYERVNGETLKPRNRVEEAAFTARAYAKLGYDYVTVHATDLAFPTGHKEQLESISLNEGDVIHSWEEFESYPWPDPRGDDYSLLEDIVPHLPEGMKLMVMGPCGVLENLIALMGYDNLCYALYEEPELVQAVADAIGSRLLDYYTLTLEHDSVGLICANDDWGFKTQTFLTPAQMRKYIFPWYRRIVEAAHAAGRPVMLHSCGNMRDVMEDIVDMGFDGKHSFEDAIQPVEEAYEAWHGRIAIMGGIDVDFLCQRSEEEIAARTRAMLERTRGRGGYLVGTGNSVPAYIPPEKYLAMVREAIGYDPLG